MSRSVIAAIGISVARASYAVTDGRAISHPRVCKDEKPDVFLNSDRIRLCADDRRWFWRFISQWVTWDISSERSLTILITPS